MSIAYWKTFLLRVICACLYIILLLIVYTVDVTYFPCDSKFTFFSTLQQISLFGTLVFCWKKHFSDKTPLSAYLHCSTVTLFSCLHKSISTYRWLNQFFWFGHIHKTFWVFAVQVVYIVTSTAAAEVVRDEIATEIWRTFVLGSP